MKILQLGKFYPIFGGVEKVMYDLTTGLSERGIKCDMLCTWMDGFAHNSHGAFYKQLNPNGWLICVEALAKVKATMIAPAMIKELRRLIRKENYDIIHVHHPDPMAAMALYLSGYDGKVVLHWHSDIVKQVTLLKYYKPIQNWLIKRADIIVGTSPVYVNESPHLAKARNKLTYLPIGIDKVPGAGENVEENETIAKKVAALRAKYPGKKIIFALGRLVEYKGYPYLIDAAKDLPDNYVVLIGGTGPMRDELAARIDAAGLDRKVKLIGFVKDEDLPVYYRACDVFSFCSIMKSEAFGIAQIEAMSCGKPVVATRIPGSGVSWVNGHGESGLNVEICDPKAIANAIMAITKDEQTYNAYCQGALDRFNRMFTRKAMIDGCLNIYGKVTYLIHEQLNARGY